MKPTRVLFLLKIRGDYYNQPPEKEQFSASVLAKALPAAWQISGKDVQAPSGWGNTNWTGLRNSVAYVVDMLQELGIEATFQRVVDDNGIDAAVTAYKPTHAIIEALWVRPMKFAALTKLHPDVRWNVRMHSELPFLAMEGIAMDWLFGYLKFPKISVSSNSLRAQADLAQILRRPIPYTPNYYPLFPLEPRKGLPADNLVDIGCFGAVRPLKNPFTQACAAIDWANQTNHVIRFHLNSDRVETGGANCLKNIRALFANTPKHQLVEHPWLDRADFMALVRMMDLGMQVSFSETFNIVSADMVIGNVPLVVSPEVSWVSRVFQADPTSTADIVAKLNVAYSGRHEGLQKQNYNGLAKFDAASQAAWPVALMGMN